MLICVLRSDDRDAALGLVEFDDAVLEREESPIATGADIAAGMDLGAALTHDDAAGEHGLAAEALHAESL